MPKDYPAGPSKAEVEKYQAEDDVRTLVGAEEIRKDKARFRRAMKMAKEKMAALEAVKQQA